MLGRAVDADTDAARRNAAIAARFLVGVIQLQPALGGSLHQRPLTDARNATRVACSASSSSLASCAARHRPATLRDTARAAAPLRRPAPAHWDRRAGRFRSRQRRRRGLPGADAARRQQAQAKQQCQRLRTRRQYTQVERCRSSSVAGLSCSSRSQSAPCARFARRVSLVIPPPFPDNPRRFATALACHSSSSESITAPLPSTSAKKSSSRARICRKLCGNSRASRACANRSSSPPAIAPNSIA